jgi:hypothetical protein
MKKILLLLIIVLFHSGIYAQNDSIYFWKSNTMIHKQSIKTADLDSITFVRPNAAGIDIPATMVSLYDIFSLSGPNGPGSSFVSVDDPGESPFIRCLVNLEDFTADGVKNRWGDNGLDQLTTATSWNSNNKFFRYHYNKLYYAIVKANQFIVVLNNANNIPNKPALLSETRFLRALAYYYLIDAFGSVPLITEATQNGGINAPQASRVQLFNYVESELNAIINDLPLTNEYGRVNKFAGKMLLAKLYLNAEVFAGVNKYNESLNNINSVINEGGYLLASNFLQNFSGDNNTSPEIIFPLVADVTFRQSYGNTTYIVNGSMGQDTMTPSDYGSNYPWSGHRATKAWYGLFGNSSAALAASNDVRAQAFWTSGHNYEMTDYKVWIDGFPSIKFRNSNVVGPSTPTAFSGTDFPLFRLADAYLIYAECVLRGATGGTISQALNYVNQVRIRSNAATITQAQLTLNFILDERARELNFEGQRRIDLIRFGKFTGASYLWPWKGNVLNGTAIPDYYKLFPIPESAIQANPNLIQNPGY